MACQHAVSLNLPGEAKATRQNVVRVSGFNKNFVAMANFQIRLHSKPQMAVQCQTILLPDLRKRLLALKISVIFNNLSNHMPFMVNPHPSYQNTRTR
jgi:hypothetical protein